MYAADLHIHTSISDGSARAETILNMAAKNGITHISFTDHDTTSGVNEQIQLAKQYGINAVPGIELSAYDHESRKKAHVLGYAYKETDMIEKFGRATLERREENCLKQIKILIELGYRIPMAEIKKRRKSCIYKQHILDWLLESGQTEALFGEVYRNIFKNNGPCDFDIEYPDVKEAVAVIKRCGGAAVLAHPGQQANFKLVKDLKKAGLDGIEYEHPSHDEKDKIIIKEEALKYGLVLTGGSDYHGRYGQQAVEVGDYRGQESSRDLFGDTSK